MDPKLEQILYKLVECIEQSNKREDAVVEKLGELNETIKRWVTIEESREERRAAKISKIPVAELDTFVKTKHSEKFLSVLNPNQPNDWKDWALKELKDNNKVDQEYASELKESPAFAVVAGQIQRNFTNKKSDIKRTIVRPFLNTLIKSGALSTENIIELKDPDAKLTDFPDLLNNTFKEIEQKPFYNIKYVNMNKNQTKYIWEIIKDIAVDQDIKQDEPVTELIGKSSPKKTSKKRKINEIDKNCDFLRNSNEIENSTG